MVDHQEEIWMDDDVWERKTTGHWSNALKRQFMRLSFTKDMRHEHDDSTKPMYPVYIVMIRNEKNKVENIVYIEDKKRRVRK